jgi:uncharacterized protein YbaR (Trm112 family)
LIHRNPYYKRIRGSHIIIVCCAYCKTDIAMYQKVSKGNLLRMYLRRIIKSSVNLSEKPGALFCPGCNEHLATRITLKRRNKEAYVMVRGAFNSRLIRQ